MIERNNAVNVAMVGYHNTLPFLFGLQKNIDFKLILDIPSKCIDYYSDHEADIALVPVATLLNRTDYKIITDYCIGCVGEVRTVSLFANTSIEEITKVFLDKDSRTSQMLTKILCAKYWNISPDFEECDVRDFDPNDLAPKEAVLMIGDKVFGKEDLFKYNYDLGTEWQNMTGLSFAFAVWIARDSVDAETIRSLNEALGQGVNNIEAVLDQNKSLATKVELSEYFKNHIDFHFDPDKKQAFKLFFNYASAVVNSKADIEV